MSIDTQAFRDLTARHRWLSGGGRLLVNAESRRCLDADRGTWGQSSTKVHLWDCAPGAPNQDWNTPVY